MHYMIRMEPFTTLHIQLQSGKWVGMLTSSGAFLGFLVFCDLILGLAAVV